MAMRQRILGSHTPPCDRRMVITTQFSVLPCCTAAQTNFVPLQVQNPPIGGGGGAAWRGGLGSGDGGGGLGLSPRLGLGLGLGLRVGGGGGT